MIWSTLLDSIATGGKNGQQIISSVLKAIKTYRKLLKSFCKGTKAETALIVHVQVSIGSAPCVAVLMVITS